MVAMASLYENEWEEHFLPDSTNLYVSGLTCRKFRK